MGHVYTCVEIMKEKGENEDVGKWICISKGYWESADRI